MKPYLKVETEFNTALGILNTVQTIFTMEQDAPPNDEIIFWTIEGAKRELKRAKETLCEPNDEFIHESKLFEFFQWLRTSDRFGDTEGFNNVRNIWETYKLIERKQNLPF